MPSAFRTRTSRFIGTAPVQVGGYVAPAATRITVIGLTCANVTGVDITVTVAHRTSAAVDTAIVVSAPVPFGSSLNVISEGLKLNLEPGDSVVVRSSAASSVDVVMSVVELT